MMSVDSWAQRYRDNGQHALMSKKKRKERAGIPTKAAFEQSLPDNPVELKRQLAAAFVDKAVVKQELDL